jgi:hypothetical protein
VSARGRNTLAYYKEVLMATESFIPSYLGGRFKVRTEKEKETKREIERLKEKMERKNEW